MKKIILALLSIFLYSCSSNEEESTNIEQDLNKSIAYFEFKLNNTPFLYQQENFTNPSFWNEYGHRYLISIDPYYRVYSYDSDLLKFNYTTTESIGLQFSNLFTASNPDDETNNFFTIFKNKPTNFITTSSSEAKGVIVGFVDKDGNYYSSEWGEQNNSLINYTSTTESTLNGYKRVIITGTVNCKLYNITDTSKYFNLTNGKFKLIFEESDQ